MDQTHLKWNTGSAGKAGVVIVEVKSVVDTSTATITKCAGFESLVDYCSIGDRPDELVENNFIIKTNIDM